MKKLILTGAVAGFLFTLFLLIAEPLGARAAYLGAAGILLYLIDRQGSLLQALSVFIGIFLGFITMVVLALKFPLPPAHLPYLAVAGGIVVFVIFILGAFRLKLEGLLGGWFLYLAGAYPVYTQDVTRFADDALPYLLGILVAVFGGLLIGTLAEKAGSLIKN